MPSKFEARDAPGKGRGLFAKQKIKAGTEILREDIFVYTFERREYDGPTMCKYPYDAPDWRSPKEYQELKKKERRDRDIETTLASFLTELVPNDAEQIRSRSKLYPGLPDVVNIFMTNRLQVDDGFDLMGLGVQSSLMNHSCIPNAYACGGWYNHRQKRAKLSITAIKDIEAGEEITVGYLLIDAPTKKRRKEIYDSFKFKCRCDICETATAETDDLFKKLADAKLQYKALMLFANRPQHACHFFRWAHTYADLLEELEIRDVRVNYFWIDCAKVACLQRDVPRAMRFLTYDHEWWQMAAPSDCPEISAALHQDTLRRLDPRNHPLWPDEGKNDSIDVKSLLPQNYAESKCHLFMTGYEDYDAYYIAIKGRDKGFYRETQDYIEQTQRDIEAEVIEELGDVKLESSSGGKGNKTKKTTKPISEAAASKRISEARVPRATSAEIESLNTSTVDGDESGFKQVQTTRKKTQR